MFNLFKTHPYKNKHFKGNVKEQNIDKRIKIFISMMN